MEHGSSGPRKQEHKQQTPPSAQPEPPPASLEAPEVAADAADAALYRQMRAALAAYDDAAAAGAAAAGSTQPPPRQLAFFAALRQVLGQVLEETTPAGRRTRLLAAHRLYIGHQPRARPVDAAAAAAMAAPLSVPVPAAAAVVVHHPGSRNEQERLHQQLASPSREAGTSAGAECGNDSNAARCRRWQQQGSDHASDADDAPAAAGDAPAVRPAPPGPVPLIAHPSLSPCGAATAAMVNAAPPCGQRSGSSACWRDLAAAQAALKDGVEVQLHLHAVHAARLQEAAWRQAGAAAPLLQQSDAGQHAAGRLLLHLDSQHAPSHVAAGPAAAQLLGLSSGGGSGGAGALLAALAGHDPLQRARQQLVQDTQRECASLARLGVSEAALGRALLPAPDVPYTTALARLPQPVGAAAAAAAAKMKAAANAVKAGGGGKKKRTSKARH